METDGNFSAICSSLPQMERCAYIRSVIWKILRMNSVIQGCREWKGYCQTQGVGLQKALSVCRSVGLSVGRSVLLFLPGHSGFNQQGGSGITRYPGLVLISDVPYNNLKHIYFICPVLGYSSPASVGSARGFSDRRGYKHIAPFYIFIISFKKGFIRKDHATYIVHYIILHHSSIMVCPLSNSYSGQSGLSVNNAYP